MMRDRHEHQIRNLDCFLGGEYEFDRAVQRVIGSHPGLSFFTDEQIAEIRAEIIRAAWFRHKLNRQNRKRRTA